MNTARFSKYVRPFFNIMHESDDVTILLWHSLNSSFFLLTTCYLAVSQPTLAHTWGDSFTSPMLITAFVQFPPESHREPCNEVGSLSLGERLMEFKPRTFQFEFQRLNPLSHSPQSTLLISVFLLLWRNFYKALFYC